MNESNNSQNNKLEQQKEDLSQRSIVEKIGGPYTVFWIVFNAFISAALGILISVILAKYGTVFNWTHAVAYSLLCYALMSFLFSNIILHYICKKAEEIEKRDLNNTVEVKEHLKNANNLYKEALQSSNKLNTVIEEKSDILKMIVEDVEKIKLACEGQEKHINAIIEATEKMSGALITIDEAVRIENGAKKDVYIISVDPKLEFKDKFYKVVCHNILKGIHYSYFFPNSDFVKINRAWKELISKFKEYKDNTTKQRIDDAILRERLKIYIVNRIHIISNIVLIDPEDSNPRNTKGWVFPIIENEKLIVSAGQLLIENAIEQTREWILQKDEFLKYPIDTQI